MIINQTSNIIMHRLNKKDYLVITPFARELFDREGERDNRINALGCFNLLKNATTKELQKLRSK